MLVQLVVGEMLNVQYPYVPPPIKRTAIYTTNTLVRSLDHSKNFFGIVRTFIIVVVLLFVVVVIAWDISIE